MNSYNYKKYVLNKNKFMVRIPNYLSNKKSELHDMQMNVNKYVM